MAARKAARRKTPGRGVALATRAIEELLCDPQPLGDIERAYPRSADAWSMELPDLASLPRPSGKKRPTRFCIATEDIVGPVRNGGIGTTYAALATLLAERGHDVTILYLKGQEVENETIDHWIEFYAGQGVKFAPVTNYALRDAVITNSDQWMRPVYNMYRWLLENPMDVVHVSEWRGSAFMCLAAKRQGIAFADTLFIVKTSSPWLWNRLYGSYPIDRLGDLSKTYAERRSVELADMVIGGSLHLLRWMASQGYRVPRDLAFVQPNVVSFDHLKEFMARRNVKAGQRVAIDEIVFFGRLEARKGLLTFCQSIRRLMKLGHRLPAKISFMGKPGARLSVRPHQSVGEYIEEETADWPCEVSILTDFQQYEAISYLLDGARLAVMPSTIENSSLAVYEAAICHIPFIASDTGGTSELLIEEDRVKVLCDPHPIPLAAKLAEAVEQGGYIARASFDNDNNIAVWTEFHDALCSGLREELLRRAAPPATRNTRTNVDVAIFSRGDAGHLEATLDSLAAQEQPPRQVIIAVDASDEAAACEHARAAAAARQLDGRVISTLDFDAGYALNEAAGHAGADYIAFLQSGWTLKPEALRTLCAVARHRRSEVLTWYHTLVPATPGDEKPGRLVAEMIGGPSETLYLDSPRDLPLFVKRGAFEALKGFTVDYRVALHEREFISKAIVSGIACETVPLDLGTVIERDAAWFERECYDVDASEFRILRPYLAALPLAMREAVLAANGLQRRAAKGGRRPGPRMQAQKFEGSTLSLEHVDMENRLGEPVLVRIASEIAAGRPWCFAGADRPVKHKTPGWSAAEIAEAMREHPDQGGSLPRHWQLVTGWGGAEADDGERYSGRVLDVVEGAVVGWIADRHDLSVPVTVEVRANGWRIASLPADLDLPSVYKLSDLASGHGFRVPLFGNVLTRLLPKSRSVEVDVTTNTGVVLVKGLQAHRAGRSMKKTPYQGYLDMVSDATVRGWVWMPADPGRRLDVTVYLDGRFYTRLHANVFRADLADHGIGGGDYAFSLRIPERFRGNKRHQIDVQVADTGIRINGSPLIIDHRGQSAVTAR